MTNRTTDRRIATVLLGAAVAFALCASTGCSLLKPKPKKPFGEACTDVFDCESLMCAEEGKFCTKICSLDTECTPHICHGDETGTGSHCERKAGTAPGGTCMERSDCDHGHCLKKVDHEDDPGFCSMHCSAPADCPDGYKTCASISDSGSIKFCLPGNEKFGVTPPKPKGSTPTTKKPPSTTSGTPTTSAKPPTSAPPATSAKPPTSAAPPTTAKPPATTTAKPPTKK